MSYFVYVICNAKNSKFTTYVGYTNNLKKRLNLHNSGKGARFTKGRKWKIIYYKKYLKKNKAMSEEYKLKKNYRLRNKIKVKFYKKKLESY